MKQDNTEPIFKTLDITDNGALIFSIGESQVYHQEYENHHQARDGIYGFIDYYDNRRPHQGIRFITPYDKLTGQGERIFKAKGKRLALKK